MARKWSCLALGLVLSAPSTVYLGVENEQEPIQVDLRVEDPTGLSRPLPKASRVTAHLEGSSVDLPVDPATQRVALPSPGRWRLCVEAEAVWARCQVIDVASAAPAAGAAAPAVTFTLWPAVTVRGRVRLADSDEVPERLGELLRVFAGPPPGKRPPADFRDTELECVVAEDGGFVCPAPATPLYAAIRLSGYVSRYVWGLEPAPGAAVDLGTVTMQKGASLAGEVDLRVPGVESGLVEVRLTPSVGPGTGTAVAATLDKDSQVSRITPLGFFQFGGVRPGSYMLVVRHPSFAVTEVGPFEVFEGKETRLNDSIRLQLPIDLSLLLEPALSPLGNPWRVEVFRRRDWSPGSDRVFSGAADPAGAVEIAAQTPGLFEIKVEDGDGNRFHATTASVEPGGSGFVPITVPLVRLRGTVRLGDDPLAATLRFGGAHGTLRSRITADEEGAFSGVLARDGEWTVEIESAEPALETVRRVEVTPGSDGVAEVDIELDDTELVGRVVTRDGRPVAGAQIKVSALSEMVTKRLTSSENGEFRSRALPAGQVMLSASAVLDGRRTTSPPTTVTLEDEIATGPVELVVEPLHSFSGRVTSATGPRPGTQVFATSLDLPVPAVASATTDLEGAFQLELPVGEGLAAFTILPPGGFLTTSVQRLQSPLDLRAATAGGSLWIDTDGSAASNSFLTIAREGVSIALPLLIRWARGHGIQVDPSAAGEPLVFPRLAEGSYRVCTVDEALRRRRLQEGASWQQIDGEATRCVSGTLTAEGTLELAVPGS
jgi:hypothetical protein